MNGPKHLLTPTDWLLPGVTTSSPAPKQPKLEQHCNAGTTLEGSPISRRRITSANLSVDEALDALSTDFTSAAMLAMVLHFPLEDVYSLIKSKDLYEPSMKKAFETLSAQFSLDHLIKSLNHYNSEFEAICEYLERWINIEHINRHLPVSQSLTSEQQNQLHQVFKPSADKWEYIFVYMHFKFNKLPPLATYSVDAEIRTVLEKAATMGTLTKQSILEALYLKRYDTQIESLEETWGITFQPPSPDEHFERILKNPEMNTPATLYSAYALMKTNSVDFISGMLMNHEISFTTIISIDDFNLLLLCSRQLDGSLVQAFNQLWINGYCSTTENYPPPRTKTYSSYESRPLQPADLACMLKRQQDQTASLDAAVTVATTLGVSFNYEKIGIECSENRIKCSENRLKCSENRIKCAGAIWLEVLRQIPFLETGHLRTIMEQFGLQDSLRQVPVIALAEKPKIQLKGISTRAAEYLEVAGWLYMDQTLATKLWQENSCLFESSSLESGQHSTNQHLLNSIAGDRMLFKQLWPLLDSCTTITRVKKKDLVNILSPDSIRPPDDHICPLTLDLMDDPVAVRLTSEKDYNRVQVFRFFSKASLLAAVHLNPINPFTRAPLYPDDVKKLQIDKQHRQLIGQWRQQNPNYS